MVFDVKRILTGLLLTLFLIQPLKVTATEEPYTLQFGVDRQCYSYITPFTVRHTIQKPDGSLFFSGTCAPQIYRLSLSGDDQRSISAYGADPSAGMRQGAYYRRINLEDSAWFDDTTAGKLRSVIRCSYPLCTPEEIQESANRWLRSLELPEIVGLQSGEAILAAQIAIWKLTGGSSYTAHSLYAGSIPLDSYADSVISRGELGQTAFAYTAQNIEYLYTYLVNLKPTPADVQLICDALIPRTVYSSVKLPDGSFRASVSVTVSFSPGEGDKLTLEGICNGQIESREILSPGEYSFTFEGLDQRYPVTLAITGLQYGTDVYLFDSAGGTDASQALVGWDVGYLPVRWERIITPVSAE